MEIVEHKGYGHPDSITDTVVEACATFLDKWYTDKYGHPLHYNVDKAMFLSGAIEITYGSHNLIKQPTFILGGQVSNMTDELHHKLKHVIRDTVSQCLPELPYFKVEIRCSSGSENLIDLHTSELCNDTSFGVGFAPLSESEQIVLAIAEYMEKQIRGGHIAFGADFKIMLIGNKITLSAPIYADCVSSFSDYDTTIQDLRDELDVLLHVEFPTSQVMYIDINPDSGPDNPYLTMCGSSIESGDDGQVGRGNRLNGLITPMRPMTLEAYHGKNNSTHTGKIYQKLAQDKANELYELDGKPVNVFLVSKIGKPIYDFVKIIEYTK